MPSGRVGAGLPDQTLRHGAVVVALAPLASLIFGPVIKEEPAAIAGSVVASGLVVTAVDAAAVAMNVDSHWGFVAVAAAVASLLTAVITVALEPLVPSCAAPRLPVAEPVYSAEAVYDQVRESTVLAVDNAKHAVGMA